MRVIYLCISGASILFVFESYCVRNSGMTFTLGLWGADVGSRMPVLAHTKPISRPLPLKSRGRPLSSCNGCKGSGRDSRGRGLQVVCMVMLLCMQKDNQLSLSFGELIVVRRVMSMHL